jgi:hypothetical protein
MMNRRSFNKVLGLAGVMSFTPLEFFTKDPEFGHNNKKYTWDKSWALHYTDPNQKVNVKDCHEMVCLPNGEMILLTNHPENNLIRFDQTGKILSATCQHFPGAHGLSLGFDDDQPFLVITDTDLHKVFYTDLMGNIKREISVPLNLGYYESAKEFVPTETVVAQNGDLYIADGYGKQYILHLDKNGKIIKVFGGKGAEDKHLDNAHGICIDYRSSTPSLIITDRNKCCFKRFTMSGEYISTISVPGANVCRPVIKGDYLYAAVLTSNATSNANTGFVIILDKKDQLISCVGGSTPSYNEKNVLLPSYQTIKLFQHPHDVMVDHDHNLYVCQWNSGQVLPYKFIPV